MTVVVGSDTNAKIISDSALSQLNQRGWRGVVGGDPDGDSLSFEMAVHGKFIVGRLKVSGRKFSGQKYVDKAASESVLQAATVALVNGLMDEYQAAKSPSTLIVKCDPEGTTLKLDQIGYLTCGPNQVSHGRHAVTAFKRGYQSGLFSVTVPPGGTETLLVSLVQDKKSQSLWYWAAGLTGVGMVVGGIGVANILTNDDAVKDGQQQPEEKNRLGLGIGLTVVGGGLTATGVILGILAHRRDSKSAVMPAPVGDGGGIVWGGSF